MRLKWLYTSFIVVLSIVIFSCDRDRNNVKVPVNDPVSAGKGGFANLKITAMDDTLAIDSCQIFIKYNASQLPTQFDDSAWCTFVDQKPPVVTFTNLKKGNYYIYARGWNIYESKTVHGGLPHTIVHDTTATFTIQLPVQPIK
jgi:hypothetical protein